VIAEQVVHHRRAAFIRDMHDVDSGHALEQFHRQMVRRTDARRAIAYFAGIVSGVVDEFLHRLDRHRGPYYEKILRLARKD
jgi:hypothetical protein